MHLCVQNKAQYNGNSNLLNHSTDTGTIDNNTEACGQSSGTDPFLCHRPIWFTESVFVIYLLHQDCARL